MNYIDNFANRAERVHLKLSPDVGLHLARSCFAALIKESHEQARLEGVSHETFRDTTKEVIDHLSIPTFTVIDRDTYLPGKRQPSLLESLDATIERYEVVDQLNDIFSGSAQSMVYGGSMKYGPFLNVRSGMDASDIDTVLLVDKERLDEIDWRGVIETNVFEEKDKITFFARQALQRALMEDDSIDITSQRFTIANKGFTISTHLIPVSYMTEAYPIIDDDITKIDNHKYVRDYKERTFERTHVNNYDMSRVLHDITVYNTPTKGGFIAYNPAYSIIDGRYVPGMYQNLVLPEARFVLGGDSQSALHFNAFSASVFNQEDQERSIDINASVANTEPRKTILPLPVEDIIHS